MRSSRVPALVLAAPLVFAACLGGSSTDTRPGTPIDCESLATSLATAEPTLTTTASGLKYRDQVVGDGATVSSGQLVAVHYSGCLTNGTKFDENNDADAALVFRSGANQVIPGFEEGVVGMKVGGRRQLVIPPELGYKEQGNGPIPPNATLVFTVDLVATQ